MIVKGTEKALHYSASVLAEKIGITVEQARQLKQGKPVNLDNRTGDMASMCESKVSPRETCKCRPPRHYMTPKAS